MKKMRKGFTLVELLIVVAVLATLASAMTMSVSGSTAKAKAATIASNVDACRRAAALYYADHLEDGTDISSTTTSTVISEYVGTWKDFTNGIITYTAAADTEKGHSAWYITVDFSGDPDKTAIITALSAVKGYGKYDGDSSVVSTGKFKVMLWSGTVTSEAVSNG